MFLVKQAPLTFLFGCAQSWVAKIGNFYFERRRRGLLADNAEASEHVSKTPDSQAMIRCPLAIFNIYRAGMCEAARAEGQGYASEKAFSELPTSN